MVVRKQKMKEVTIKLSKWSILKTVLVLLLIGGAFFFGATATVPTAYEKGYNEGYVHALSDVQGVLAQKGIDFGWQDLGDGKYILTVSVAGNLYARGNVTVDLYVQHYRDGALLSSERGAGVLTNIGKSWLEQQISGTVNASQAALYLADSNDATDPALATWTQLPSEITNNGLDRQLGAYTHTGAANTGTWNVSKTKSVTATQSTQVWGLHWKAYADSADNCLLAADTTPAQKNCVNGDTLAETWQVAVA
jgi:hypothetical protein